ncbi:PhoH family protein [Vibrio harveyi]|uniref:PhoH family protein n=1 Tax=Vibrio harveyi TaxID=669 RepID=UPI003CEF212A
MAKNKKKVVSIQAAQSPSPSPKKRNPWALNLIIREFFNLSTGQQNFLDAYDEGKKIMCGLGMAGTGKTSLAAYLALCDLMSKDNDVEHVKFVRSVVPVRDMGFLKGSQSEKEGVYNIYKDMVNDIFGRSDAWSILEAHGFVSFCSTSFEQGKTYDNTIVVLDEIGNMNFKEIDLIVSRLGYGSRIMLIGDLNQSYLNTRKEDECGVKQFISIIERMNTAHVEFFSAEDIIRCDLVRDYISMREHVLHKEKLPGNYGTVSD